MLNPYAVFAASLLGTVILSLCLIAAPFIFQGEGRSLAARVVLLVVAIALCLVMKHAYGRLTLDKYSAYWPVVASGGAYMMVVMAGFATVLGVVRYLLTPLDTASREREIDEGRRETSDADRRYSKWDDDYHRKRRGG